MKDSKDLTAQVGRLCEYMASGAVSESQKWALAAAINGMLHGYFTDPFTGPTLNKARSVLARAIEGKYKQKREPLGAFLVALKSYMGDSFPLESYYSSRRSASDLHREAMENARLLTLGLLRDLYNTIVNADNRYDESHINAVINRIAGQHPVLLRYGDEKGKTFLHFAAKHGNCAAITTLIAYAKDPNPVDHQQCTPLHLAAEYNQMEAIITLLAQGALPQLEDKDGNMPIHYAAYSGAYDAFYTLQPAFEEAEGNLGELLKLAADKCVTFPMNHERERGYLCIISDLLEAGARGLTAEHVIHFRQRLQRLNDEALLAVFNTAYGSFAWQEQRLTPPPLPSPTTTEYIDAVSELAGIMDAVPATAGDSFVRSLSPQMASTFVTAFKIQEILDSRKEQQDSYAAQIVDQREVGKSGWHKL